MQVFIFSFSTLLFAYHSQIGCCVDLLIGPRWLAADKLVRFLLVDFYGRLVGTKTDECPGRWYVVHIEEGGPSLGVGLVDPCSCLDEHSDDTCSGRLLKLADVFLYHYECKECRPVGCWMIDEEGNSCFEQEQLSCFDVEIVRCDLEGAWTGWI